MEDIEKEEPYSLNVTPLREVNTKRVSTKIKESLDITPGKNYTPEKHFDKKEKTSTSKKRKSTTIIKRENRENRENRESRENRENKEEEEEKEKEEEKKKEYRKGNSQKGTKVEINCSVYDNSTPKKRRIKENELSPFSTRASTTEKNKYVIHTSNKNELNESQYSNSIISPLKIVPSKENETKKKRKTAVYKETLSLQIPTNKKETYDNYKKKNIHITTTSEINNERYEIDGINLHDLPEHVKSEYVSYLHSPLKRSERIIKTKINKMLDTHKKEEENQNKNYYDERERERERDYDENDYDKKETRRKNKEDAFKDSKDVNKMACDFFPKDEERCWDEFYTQSVDKAKPFTGITTETAVQIITQLLKNNIRKVKRNNEEFYSPISENDTIMEIGHGTHPLAVAMQQQWGTVGRYIGIEFSGAASTEALKCTKLKDLLIKRKVEFIKILNMNYYENDSLNGVVVESNISPKNTKTDFIKKGSFKYIFAKSTLDYITCRLDNSGNSTDWEDDLQVSPTVVQMFNSLSDSLQDCTAYNIVNSSNNSSNNNNNNNNSTTSTATTTSSNNSVNKKGSYIIFVEPSDPAKFRDHILTIFKVIYTATFKYNSSAKYLKLIKIINLNKACGYMIEKRNAVFRDFEEMRQETTKLILKTSYAKYIDESDWFFPTSEPKKWISSRPEDIEYLVNLDYGKI